jgi:hypothetical protein
MKSGSKAAVVALIAIGSATAADAQMQLPTGACLQRAEAEAVTVFVLPTLVEGVARKCRASLPATATLTNQVTTLSARYRADAAAAWPKARDAFARLADPSIAELFGEDLTRTMIETSVTSLIIERVAVKDCGRIDQAVDALMPLPARNVGKLVTMAADLLADDGRKFPIPICEVSSR